MFAFYGTVYRRGSYQFRKYLVDGLGLYYSNFSTEQIECGTWMFSIIDNPGMYIGLKTNSRLGFDQANLYSPTQG
jgi:hypothetical protein